MSWFSNLSACVFLGNSALSLKEGNYLGGPVQAAVGSFLAPRESIKTLTLTSVVTALASSGISDVVQGAIQRDSSAAIRGCVKLGVSGGVIIAGGTYYGNSLGAIVGGKIPFFFAGGVISSASRWVWNYIEDRIAQRANPDSSAVNQAKPEDRHPLDHIV